MRIYKTWDDLQSNLLLRPSLWVISLGILALLLVRIDSQFSWLVQRGWLLTGGAEGARIMLGSISAAMLTVTSLTFSIMMLAVVQTANAYSPRVLREFLSDTSNQHVLGVLIGTFLFSLLVLRGVRTFDDDVFVPVLSTNVALLLSLLSTGAFIYFINHVAQSIKVSNIIHLIVANTEELVQDMFPIGVGQPWTSDAPPALPDEVGALAPSPASGYIQLVEPEAIIKVAVAADVVIRLEHGIGDFILTGTPLATVWPATALDARVVRAIQQSIVLGQERTLVQDVLFGMQHLSDIALRALSPSVNDPTTALDCINGLATLLVRLLQREPVSPYRCDPAGRLRVIARELTFAETLDQAFSQIVRYGAHDISVVLRLLAVCGELGYVSDDPAERQALWELAQVVAVTADGQMGISQDRQRVNDGLAATAVSLRQDAAGYLVGN